jgi:16S rRNA (uracil1498-N3)-methyltransferase
MRFFFLREEPPSLHGDWQPPADLGQHLRALRLGPGEALLLLLPRGGALRATIAEQRRLLLHGLAEPPRMPLLPVTLATAWPKAARAEDLVTRAAEAGVERIIPLACERSITGREDFSDARRERWERLVRETCQQCARPTLPAIDPAPVPLQQILREAPLAHPIALVPGGWPLQHELDLRAPREVLLLIGPEGGFSPAEEQWLGASGIAKAGLLPTILRIEAAGPLAAAICQHDFLARSAY